MSTGTGAATDHAGHERRAQRDGRLDEHPHLVELAFGVGEMKRAPGGEAGVVDEDVDLESERRDPRGQPLARGRLGEIAAERLGAHRVLGGDLRGDLLEAVLAPGDEDDAVAATGELVGDRGADARPRHR